MRLFLFAAAVPVLSGVSVPNSRGSHAHPECSDESRTRMPCGWPRTTGSIGQGEGKIERTPREESHIKKTRSSLVQVMAWHMMVPSHYLNQCWHIANWTLSNKIKWNFNCNMKIFYQKFAFENIFCEMAAILFRPQSVNFININFMSVALVYLVAITGTTLLIHYTHILVELMWTNDDILSVRYLERNSSEIWIKIW